MVLTFKSATKVTGMISAWLICTNYFKERKMGVEVSGILGLIILILDVLAIVKTLQSGASTGNKVLWVVLIILLPIVGLLLWFFMGPRGGGTVNKLWGARNKRWCKLRAIVPRAYEAKTRKLWIAGKEKRSSTPSKSLSDSLGG